MCGLGIIAAPDGGATTEDGWAMLSVLRHRGPDGSRVAALSRDEALVLGSRDESPRRSPVVMAHARLAIIDLSAAGAQPMSNEDGSVWVAVNGEIYNFRELRRELEGKGHRFRSHSDSEVIVHGWEEWGRDVLPRLEGIFALALHDRKTGTTLVARDRLGVKPLYYGTRVDGAFMAASEVKALLAGGMEARLDPVALDSYLRWLWVPDPATLFAGVSKLEPGHAMEIGPTGERCDWRYWDFEWDREAARPSADELRDALEEAVSRQLVADVPLGAFFSGGLDSTAVVELMGRAIAPERPTCFAVGFSERDLKHDVVTDDLRYARRYASDHPIDYREEILRPDLVDRLPKVIWHLDEPVADPAALSAYAICEAASGDLTVMLSGAGGDEVFGGYPRYVATGIAERYRRLPSVVRSATRGAVSQLPGAGAGRVARFGRNAKKLLAGADAPFPDNYLSFLSYFEDEERGQLYANGSRGAFDPGRTEAVHRAHLQRVAGQPWLHQAQYLDLKTFLPALNLTYMDKMSMAHSIEVRVPLLDERVLDVMRRTTPDARLTGRGTKRLFKDALTGIVPDEIINRPKAGFTAPLRGWLSHELAPLVDEILSPSVVRERGLFETRSVKALLGDFHSGRRDTALQIWQLVTLELWQRTFIDRAQDRVTEGALAL